GQIGHCQTAPSGFRFGLGLRRNRASVAIDAEQADTLVRGIPATVISDDMMGTLFAQGEINKLCLFYDALTEEGPRGICGSQLAARLAYRHGVEVELFSGVEERRPTHDRDAGTFLGRKLCPAGARVHTIGPEVVPWSVLKN
ncbi:MAG TPA: hypothetical protein VJQ55_04915, partial [Candidatus Binatia bacterium]|nr:hypothetical protein [Candidatus Binatia bacterium]